MRGFQLMRQARYDELSGQLRLRHSLLEKVVYERACCVCALHV